MEQPNNQFTQQAKQFAQPMPGQQPVMTQTPRKKPKKLGWIISLVIVVIGVLGLAIGGVMSLSNNPKTVVESIEKGIDDDSTKVFVNPQQSSFDESGKSAKYNVTKGNTFLIVFLSNKSENLPKIIVDGKEIAAFYTEKNTEFVGSSVKIKSYYYVIATSDEMTIQQEGTEEISGFPYLIGKPNLIEKVVPIVTTGIIILCSLIFTGVALVVFTIFLVIFLVKNSAYKKTQVSSNF